MPKIHKAIPNKILHRCLHFESDSVRSALEHSKNYWDRIVPLYSTFFYYARFFGLLPYTFNSQTLEIEPIKSGIGFYLFMFNTCYIYLNILKVGVLFGINLWTGFEFEEIKGGWFFQLAWLVTLGLVESLKFSYTYNGSSFASTLSHCIRLEKKILTGNTIELLITKSSVGKNEVGVALCSIGYTAFFSPYFRIRFYYASVTIPTNV